MTTVCVPGAGMLACSDGVACTLDLCVAGLGCVFTPMGDCNLPPDAGPDAADARDASDALDSMMSGGDATSDRADMSMMPDATQMETGGSDVSPPADALKEAGSPDASPEAGTDGGGDAGADTTSDGAEVSVDAMSDGSIEVEDDVIGQGPDLRASGGACNCNTAPSPSDPVLVLVLVLVAVLVLEGRRRAVR
jgi:MYXO-CTERM domain-containing protein